MPSLVYVGSFLPRDTLDHDLYRKVLLVPPECPFCVAVPPYMVVKSFLVLPACSGVYNLV